MSRLAQSKILILEEEPSVRNSLLTILASLGCEAEVADTGRQAIDIIRHKKFDAMLLDLRCSRAQTAEVVSWIQWIRPTLLAKVLVLTDDAEDAETLDLIERYVLSHVSANRPLLDMAEALRMLLQLPQILN